MIFERVCSVCGRPTNSPMCPECGSETQDRTETWNGAAYFTPTSPEGNAEETSTEVVFLGTKDVVNPWSRKGIIRRLVGGVYLCGIPIMCASLAIAGHLRVVFILETLFGLQMVYLFLRTKSLTGPMIDDEDIKSRVSPPLIELCAIAGIPAPRVRIQQSVISAGMMLYQKSPLLCLSPDFLEQVDDRVLRAVIAHEVIHQKEGDLAASKKRNSAIGLLWYGAFLVSLFSSTNMSWVEVAAYIGSLFPFFRLMVWASGFSWQKRETRADIQGVAAADDPDAAIRGLRMMYEQRPQRRRSILGPPAIRWMLFPYSLPPTTHPSLEKRIAAIRAIADVGERSSS